MLESVFNVQAQIFLKDLFSSFDEKLINLPSYWDLDHICYRVQTLERYDQLKKSFLQFSHLLAATVVNGREISTFKLKQPLYFRDWRIDLVELPAPKDSSPMPEGFEHIEIVCDEPFEDIEKRMSSIKIDRSSLQKEFNAELKVKLKNGVVKFHHISLESVIRLENNTSIWSAIQNLQILKKLKKYNPLIAGTFPLDLQIPGSDVDILMSASDLNECFNEIKKTFSGLESLSDSFETVQGVETLIVNFKFQNVCFEIFVQNQPTVLQRGYQHFLIEERLLKYGGEVLRSKVEKWRQSGCKTEAAFARALSLSEEGDPYLQILKFSQLSCVSISRAISDHLLSFEMKNESKDIDTLSRVIKYKS